MENLERPAPFDVEELFNQFVLEIKGELGSNLIPNTENQPNADYVFKEPQVIAELKCLQKDHLSTIDDSERIDSFIKKWAKKGFFDKEEELKQMLISRQLPIDCAKDLFTAVRNSISAVVHKANNQIRETKKLLNMPNAKGLLLICNDGNYCLPNMKLMHLIVSLVYEGNKNPDIDGVLYFTINQTSRYPGEEENRRIWFPVFKTEDELLKNFVYNMNLSFTNDFFSRLTGIPLEIIDSTDNVEEGYKDVMKMEYVPKEIVFPKKRGGK